MAEIVIVGGGIGGLSAAVLLARDGHRVTVLERDPAPPPRPEEAWARWERRGVNQFRLPHLFLARFRAALDDELPDVATALEDAGALRLNPLDTIPDEVTGGRRDGDDRFEQLTGRRPLMEAAMAGVAGRQEGVSIRRGVAVRGLLAAPTGPGDAAGVPWVSGVVTEAGEHLLADLVVDAGGRRSNLPAWLAAIGARRPVEVVADCGYVYYGRHYRSADGAMPVALGAPLLACDSVSLLTLVADQGHWSVVLVASARDAAMRRARDPGVWERVVRSYPLVAHWTDAEPVTGIDVMAKIEDRVRHLTVDGHRVATGVVSLGDAAACTNPSIGRGATIALLHAICLRDAARTATAGGSATRAGFDVVSFSDTWDELSAARVEPLVQETLVHDRHRRAEIEAQLAGRSYESDDPAWRFSNALQSHAATDPDLLRARMDVGGLLARGCDVASRPGIMEKLTAAGPPQPAPGPTRDELLEVLGTATNEEEPACASR